MPLFIAVFLFSPVGACLPASSASANPSPAFTSVVPTIKAEDQPSPVATALPTASPKPLVWPFSPPSTPVANPPIQNFGIIEEGIVCRSAQPNNEEYRFLVTQGFKSVISFRREVGNEEKRILALGYKYYLHLDIEDENQPTNQQAEDFLAFVTNKQHWPIIMHCKVGVGRTGTMAALIRYAVDGWTMEQAMEESLYYRGGIRLVTPQVRWLEDWAATHPPGSHLPKVQ
jgi:protein-tyrosine phosphatase